jgi:hypothetical protein
LFYESQKLSGAHTYKFCTNQAPNGATKKQLMNPILNEIIEKRNGFYCHCIEVSDVYELENVAEQIMLEYSEKYSEKNIIDFLESLTVYALDESKEDEIYSFSFTEYIKDML